MIAVISTLWCLVMSFIVCIALVSTYQELDLDGQSAAYRRGALSVILLLALLHTMGSMSTLIALFNG